MLLPVRVSVPGPALVSPVAPPLSAMTLPIVRLAGVMTISSPPAEPAKVPPLMAPEVLPIRPPPSSVSEPEPVIVTPSVPVRFSVLNDTAEVHGALRAGRRDVEGAAGGQRAKIAAGVGSCKPR